MNHYFDVNQWEYEGRAAYQRAAVQPFYRELLEDYCEAMNIPCTPEVFQEFDDIAIHRMYYEAIQKNLIYDPDDWRVQAQKYVGKWFLILNTAVKAEAVCKDDGRRMKCLCIELSDNPRNYLQKREYRSEQILFDTSSEGIVLANYVREISGFRARRLIRQSRHWRACLYG